jgi:glycosyltransferase involved in cell wall biosynthesis
MHFPIDIAKYKVQFENRVGLRAETRLKYSISESDVVLAVVGKLVHWKNQDHIIDALVILESQGIFLTLFILGSGETFELCKTKSAVLTRSRVLLPGFVKADELPAYYAATDLYVHPASVEPHSIAVSEAIYMGCPVILSDRCGSYGPSDDVQEGKNGLVYPFGDVGRLAERIKQLLDPATRESFGRHSHEISSGFQHRAHYQVLELLKEKLAS